ncbi:DUF2786 domain-containing protein [Sporomusa sp.]|uniref:DUF2786 domain-containing protein n=1 Tax=Sporomusa sp. TaxID=2078658 RepID=UPI002D1B91F0|nr:DUF2786 domain-containing protein [Sporomusa sp.]HWR07777.1 DUF2786 domain-containing protein [Sporomusa sp.]
MEPEQEKIILKIRKLLKLSSSNFNGESEAALLKVQQLLIEHDLSMADLGSPDTQQKVSEEILEYTSAPWWYKDLISIIADNFRCESLIRSRAYSRWRGFILIGREIDVQISKELFRHAVVMIKHNGKPFKAYGTAHENAYIKGFLEGLKVKFQEQVEKHQWGLILVKDKEVIEAKDSHNPREARKPTAITVASNQEAFSRGYIDGRTLDHQHKQINGADA